MMRAPFREKCRQTAFFKKPGNWAAGYHTGEDWVCDTDRTLVSPAQGIVLASGWANGYGNRIIIRTNEDKVLLMAHMQDKPILSKGVTVKAGEKVGIMGASGGNWGAHLHIEVQNSITWAYNRNLLKPSDYIDFQKLGEVQDLTEAEVKKICMAWYDEENPMYNELKDVPKYWREEVKELVDRGIILGDGTHTIAKRHYEIMAIIVAKRYTDKKK